jgi:hypothetical protein
MAYYHFQTQEFGMSATGIHLLRSGFNYRTIPFSEIKSIQIIKGKQLRHWWAILIVGLALFAVGASLSIYVIYTIMEGELTRYVARAITVLLIPVIGGYFVYNALETGMILKIECINGRKERLPLKELERRKQLQPLTIHLKEWMGSRLQPMF